MTKAVGSESGPAWKTSTLRSIPTCVAANPTPIASRMIAIIRSTSARSSGPNSVTGEALLFSAGVAELDDERKRRLAALEQLGLEPVLGGVGRLSAVAHGVPSLSTEPNGY